MHKLVLDTNIIVSACISENTPPGKIVDQLFLEDKVEICLSAEVLEEYVEVLNREKFSRIKGFSASAHRFLRYVTEYSLWFDPTEVFAVSRDADDDMFLNLAVAASADFLVTGNLKDFPAPTFHSVRIVSPADYWQNYYQLTHDRPDR